MSSEYIIRNLAIEDIPEAMKLVLAEGWNQTENDWKLFIENQDNNCKCLIAEGHLVGTATSYRFSKDLAWVSMVLVDKNFRGRGYGKVLMKAVLAELKDCKSVKLDATPAGEKVYEKLGFEKEYSISRWICDSFVSRIHNNPGISEIKNTDLKLVIDFDKNAFGAERSKLIRSLDENFPQMCRISKIKNEISGIALGRIGNRHYQIGPVAANSDTVAKNLIASVLAGLQNQSVVIDVLDDKAELTRWLSDLGFQQKRQFWRMYLNDNSYSGKPAQQFAICGPEFG